MSADPRCRSVPPAFCESSWSCLLPRLTRNVPRAPSWPGTSRAGTVASTLRTDNFLCPHPHAESALAAWLGVTGPTFCGQGAASGSLAVPQNRANLPELRPHSLPLPPLLKSLCQLRAGPGLESLTCSWHFLEAFRFTGNHKS